MKILYGVQGTGNGHITRARVMAQAFRQRNIPVQFIFSGRPPEKYYDMEIFGDYRCYTGLSFVVKNGRVDNLATLKQTRPLQFFRDKKKIRADRFDLVITDFEPLTAWSARQHQTPSLGIGHQYAFNYDIPRASDSLIARQVMRYFAPANYRLGLHWHHFNQPILPPIIAAEHDLPSVERKANSVVVYLPFENQADLIQLFQKWPDYQFSIFANSHPPGQYQNVAVHQQSREGFQKTLVSCERVICNAGFELISETLSLGKKLLVCSLQKQMEQLSNAAALDQLDLAQTETELSANAINQWLNAASGNQIRYPNTAEAIVKWIVSGELGDPATLAKNLWLQADCPERPGFFSPQQDCQKIQ